MFKDNAIIRIAVGFICFIALILGCDQKAEAPPKPQVVTKKIIAQKEAPSPAAPLKVQEVAPVPEKPTPKPAPPVVVKAAPVPTAQIQPRPAPEPKVQVRQPAPKPAPEIAAPPVKAEKKEEPGAPAVKTEAPQQQVEKVVRPDLEEMLVARKENGYRPEGRLDPFEPLFKKEPVAAPQVDQRKTQTKRRIPRTPLEMVALSQLKLVGVILSPKENKALVEETSGKGYVVKVGTYIGNRNGKIVEILSDRIIVAEEVPDIYSNVSVQNSTLQIQKPPGE